MANRQINPNCQRGMMLIMLVFMLGIAATAYLVHALNGNTVKIERDRKTVAALAEAKAALIGWAVSGTTPGQLPCPEDISKIGTPSEGESLASCTSPLPAIGRFPWKSLGTWDLRDGYGEKLWYVVSPGFSAPPINGLTSAQLSIDGVTGNTVAIIFSPGPPLPNQSRPTPSAALPPIQAQYLDLSNNDGDATFVTSGSPDSFNDELILIGRADFLSVVALRVFAEIRGDMVQGVKNYYLANGNKFPFADTDGDGHQNNFQLTGDLPFNDLSFVAATNTMLSSNGWLPLVTNYTVSSDQQRASLTLNNKTLSIVP